METKIGTVLGEPRILDISLCGHEIMEPENARNTRVCWGHWSGALSSAEQVGPTVGLLDFISVEGEGLFDRTVLW